MSEVVKISLHFKCFLMPLMPDIEALTASDSVSHASLHLPCPSVRWSVFLCCVECIKGFSDTSFLKGNELQSFLPLGIMLRKLQHGLWECYLPRDSQDNYPHSMSALPNALMDDMAFFHDCWEMFYSSNYVRSSSYPIDIISDSFSTQRDRSLLLIAWIFHPR